jgi:excisionase family DNA binding protein
MKEVLLQSYGPMMTVDELAELLRITRQTLYTNLNSPDFPIKYARLGKRYLFNTEHVSDYITGNYAESETGVDKQEPGTLTIE